MTYASSMRLEQLEHSTVYLHVLVQAGSAILSSPCIMNDPFVETRDIETSRRGPYEDCDIMQTHTRFLSGTFMS